MESLKNAPREARIMKMGARLWGSSAKMPRWAWIALAVLAALLVALLGYKLPWTGFGEASWPKSEKLEYRPAKTVWDWLGLLVVPGLLFGGGIWFTYRRENLSREIEERRRKEERELESDRLREEALQGYVDRMAGLMVDKKLGRSEEDDPVRDVARSLTLLVSRRLDGQRRGLLLTFLSESKLIARDGAVVELGYVDLRGAHLGGAYLRRTDLRLVLLHCADLGVAQLIEADLREAYLIEAKLSSADLTGADLRGAVLRKTHLGGAHLDGADLDGADLREAELPQANLRGANLRKADLVEAHLTGADHTGAFLDGAY